MERKGKSKTDAGGSPVSPAAKKPKARKRSAPKAKAATLPFKITGPAQSQKPKPGTAAALLQHAGLLTEQEAKDLIKAIRRAREE